MVKRHDDQQSQADGRSERERDEAVQDYQIRAGVRFWV